MPYVFKYLPQIEVVPLYFELDGTFPNHPAWPIEDENKLALRKAVLEHRCDLGAAFDGDADRMFIVDEQGGFPDGSIVTAAVGVATLKKYPGSKILYNLICSRSVPEAVTAHGGIPVRSQVGHSLIKPEMRVGEHSVRRRAQRPFLLPRELVRRLRHDRADAVPRPLQRARRPDHPGHRAVQQRASARARSTPPVADPDAKMREIEDVLQGRARSTTSTA